MLLGNLLSALWLLATGGLTPSIWIAFLLLFLYGLAHEALYNIEDIEGDRQSAIRTVATYFVARKPLTFYRELASIFIIAACWLWFAGWVWEWHFYTVIP